MSILRISLVFSASLLLADCSSPTAITTYSLAERGTPAMTTNGKRHSRTDVDYDGTIKIAFKRDHPTVDISSKYQTVPPFRKFRNLRSEAGVRQ